MTRKSDHQVKVEGVREDGVAGVRIISTRGVCDVCADVYGWKREAVRRGALRRGGRG